MNYVVDWQYSADASYLTLILCESVLQFYVFDSQGSGSGQPPTA